MGHLDIDLFPFYFHSHDAAWLAAEVDRLVERDCLPASLPAIDSKVDLIPYWAYQAIAHEGHGVDPLRFSFEDDWMRTVERSFKAHESFNA